MRESLVIHLQSDPAAAVAWYRVDVDSGRTQGESDLDTVLDQAGSARLILLVPTEKVHLTSISLPIRQPSRLLRAVPYALEERLAADVDELHFSIGPRQADGSTPVAAVQQDQMRAWLAPFVERGLYPDMLLPDALALPLEADQWTLLLQANGRAMLRTGAGSGYALPQDLMLTQLTSEAPGLRIFRQGQEIALPDTLTIIQTRMIDHVLDALDPANAPRLNMLHGEFAPQRETDKWLKAARLPVALAASWLILATLNLYLDNHAAAKTYAHWQDLAQERFSSAFPHITRIVDMRVQAEQELARMRAGAQGTGMLHLLDQVSPALSKVKDLKLDGVQYREGSMYLNLSGQDLQALERLRGEIAAIPTLRFEVQSAQAGTEGVLIRLKLDQA